MHQDVEVSQASSAVHTLLLPVALQAAWSPWETVSAVSTAASLSAAPLKLIGVVTADATDGTEYDAPSAVALKWPEAFPVSVGGLSTEPRR